MAHTTITETGRTRTALRCTECEYGIMRQLANTPSAILTCSFPECDHTVNSNLDLALDAGESLLIDGQVAYVVTEADTDDDDDEADEDGDPYAYPAGTVVGTTRAWSPSSLNRLGATTGGTR